ncbi:homoserine kinase [Nakamurella lactea]|uniref:homoserine kinase n=1 Tax=Nakamurella lactea TaxID=459515 RepID=UPI000A04E495|nr:homoserine kinase [Nakamurella lactea]
MTASTDSPDAPESPVVPARPWPAVRVRVPATSANLGPGYDCFGLALGRYDLVTARRTDGPLRITVTGCGSADVPLTADHLVYRSAVLGFEALGEPVPRLELVCSNEIPHGGGQGSSAAAIVAGIAVARMLTPGGPERMSRSDLLNLAAGVEGHPDNAAPAVLGGFTIAWTEPDGRSQVVQRPVHPQVRVLLFSARRGSSTERARALLPTSVPHADAAANSAAAALFVHAISDEPALLLTATADYLHQRYRAPSMPETAALVADLRAAGIAAVVSGAGPSVLAFVTGEIDGRRWQRPGFDLVELPIDRRGLQIEQIAADAAAFRQ